ncbi:chemotaxis protein [Thiomonas sp.]
MKRTPQRSLLLLSLLALVWGGALAILAGLGASFALLLTAWGAGAALLVSLAFYLGLSFRLDLLQVQQALHEAVTKPEATAQLESSLAAFWQPLIDAASAARLPVEAAAREKAQMNAQFAVQTAAQTAAQLAALQSALDAERTQGSAWQRQAAQAQAELGLLRQQVQETARTLERAEAAQAALAALPPLPEPTRHELGAMAHERQAALAELKSVVVSLTAEVQKQSGLLATQQRRAEQLAQSAEALTLLGLNLRLQLSHLAASPTADAAVLEQTEADLDALLGAAARQAGEAAVAPVPSERPAGQTPRADAPGDAPSQMLARLRDVTAQIDAIADAATQQDKRMASLHRQWTQWHLAAQGACQAIAQAARKT